MSFGYVLGKISEVSNNESGYRRFAATLPNFNEIEKYPTGLPYPQNKISDYELY